MVSGPPRRAVLHPSLLGSPAPHRLQQRAPDAGAVILIKAIPREALCAWAAKTQSVAALYVFGSYARGEATDASDLDIALELAPKDGQALAELIQHAAAWKAELGTATGIRVKDIYLASDSCTTGKLLIFCRSSTAD